MYKKIKPARTSLGVNQATEGETIEQKMERVVNNKEPINDGAPIIHTERKDGVRPEHNIRTDRFDIAVEAMESVSKSNTAKRQMRVLDKEEKPEDKTGENGEAKSTEGTK